MTPVTIHPSPVTDEIPRIPHQFRTSGSFQEITGCRLQGGGYKGVSEDSIRFEIAISEYRYLLTAAVVTTYSDFKSGVATILIFEAAAFVTSLSS